MNDKLEKYIHKEGKKVVEDDAELCLYYTYETISGEQIPLRDSNPTEKSLDEIQRNHDNPRSFEFGTLRKRCLVNSASK